MDRRGRLRNPRPPVARRRNPPRLRRDNNNNDVEAVNNNQEEEEEEEGGVVMQDVNDDAVPAAAAAAAAAPRPDADHFNGVDDNNNDVGNGGVGGGENAPAAGGPPLEPRHNVEQDDDDDDHDNGAELEIEPRAILDELLADSGDDDEEEHHHQGMEHAIDNDDDDDDDDDDVDDALGLGIQQQLIEGGVADPDPSDVAANDGGDATNRLASDADITLFFTCTDMALLRDYPDHPILNTRVRVQIGMGKNTKLHSVFKRFLQVCNDPDRHASTSRHAGAGAGRATNKKQRQPPPQYREVEREELEFVHSQLLDGSNTAEIAALMKNDVIAVRKNRVEERQKQKERDRFQRETDTKFVSFMHQQFQFHDPDTVIYCRGTLVQLNEELGPKSSTTTNSRHDSSKPLDSQSQKQHPSPFRQPQKLAPSLPFRNISKASSTQTMEDDSDNNMVIDHDNNDYGTNCVPCHAFMVQKRCPWLGSIIRQTGMAQKMHQIEQELSSSSSSSRGKDEQAVHEMDDHPVVENDAAARLPPQNPTVAVVQVDANLDGENGETLTDDGWDGVEHVVGEPKNNADKSDNDGIVVSAPAAIHGNAATESRKSTILEVALDHPIEAVQLLMEYIYTNRVVSLGHDAFVTACKTKPTHDKGPVPPYSTANRSSRRGWPNRGEPMVTFSIATATIVLAERANMPRLSLMAEVAAANLVTPTLVVHALTLCQKMKSDTGNELSRLRKASLEVVLRSAVTDRRAVWVLPSFRQELQENKNLLVPALITGTVEVLEDVVKTNASSISKNMYRSISPRPDILTHDPIEWQKRLFEGFRVIDRQDRSRRAEERGKRAIEQEQWKKAEERRKRALERISSSGKAGEEEDSDDKEGTNRDVATANVSKRPRRAATNAKPNASIHVSRASHRPQKRGQR